MYMSAGGGTAGTRRCVPADPSARGGGRHARDREVWYTGASVFSVERHAVSSVREHGPCV